MALLEQPAVAVALGAVTGLIVSGILFFPTRRSKPQDVAQTMVFSILGIILSTVLGLGIIYAYSRLAPGSVAWFGVSTVASFLVGLAIFAVRVTRK